MHYNTFTNVFTLKKVNMSYHLHSAIVHEHLGILRLFIHIISSFVMVTSRLKICDP